MEKLREAVDRSWEKLKVLNNPRCGVVYLSFLIDGEQQFQGLFVPAEFKIKEQAKSRALEYFRSPGRKKRIRKRV
jgi:hypothetical protein